MISFNTDVILPHERLEFVVVKIHRIPELHGSLFAAKSPQLRVPCLKATRFNELTDHLIEDIRNFAAGGGHSSLWPEATIFLNHRGAYSRPEAAIVACGQRPQGCMNQESRLNPGHLVTLLMSHKSTLPPPRQVVTPNKILN